MVSSAIIFGTKARRIPQPSTIGNMAEEDRNINQLTELEPLIQNSLTKGSPFLSFPHSLETIFTEQDTPLRRKRYLLLGLAALMMYNLFCIADRFMLPDIYLTAWKIRLGIVTPAIAVFLILINVKKLVRFMDIFAGCLMVITSASIIGFLILSNHPNVVHYHTGIILIVTFGNIVVRIRFRHAVGFSILILALYVSFIGHVPQMPAEAADNSSLVLLTGVLISLIGNYQLETESRRHFLMTLRQKINTVRLEESNRKLEQLSISDELTGTANRRHFNATFDREWNSAARNNYPLSLIFLDIDFFKPYNDNYGHQAGDRCLKKIGDTLNHNVRRAYDLPARYGGEEFVVLLPHTEIQEALLLAETIRKQIEQLDIVHEYSDIADHVTVSLGVAGIVPEPRTLPSLLLKQADTALYQAKNQGRNQSVSFVETD